MERITGTYRITRWDHDEVRAFVPSPLPPRNPRLTLDAPILRILANANAALGKLSVAANMVPNADWFLGALSLVVRLLNVSKPTAARSIELLQVMDILRETTGKRRDRVYAYHHYLKILTPDTE